MIDLAITTITALSVHCAHAAHRVEIAMVSDRRGRIPVTVTGPGYVESFTEPTFPLALASARRVVKSRAQGVPA